MTSRLINTARNLATSFGKIYAGPGGERQPLLTKLHNVKDTAWFLVARKLGLNSHARLVSSNAGCRHTWPLVHWSDVGVIEEIFIDKMYALDIPPPKLVFDLGANIGAASVYFAQTWPNARIIAVEASPDVFTRLRENTKDYLNITCLNYAVCAQDGSVDFVVSTDHIASSLRRPDPKGHVVSVPGRTLASLIAEVGADHVDLLKFDIEGAEEELFEDPTVLTRIGSLIGEVHRDMIRVTEAEFLARLSPFHLERRFDSGDLFVISGVRRS